MNTDVHGPAAILHRSRRERDRVLAMALNLAARRARFDAALADLARRVPDHKIASAVPAATPPGNVGANLPR